MAAVLVVGAAPGAPWGTMAETVPCGTPMLSRIVGGSASRSGQWPWQSSVSFQGRHVCGGALIAPRWLLSAAHCFPPENPLWEYRVTLGAVQLLSPPPDAQVLRVLRVLPHPSYRPDGGGGGGPGGGDLALVLLDPPVTPTRTVRPICLPPQGLKFPPGTNCTVTGWGDVRSDAPLPPPKSLQQLPVPLIGRRRCRCLYDRPGRGGDSDSDSETPAGDTLCAGYGRGGRDACQGDSGGPLSCLVGDTWLLAGIVSWGEACGLPGRPGVYTRTAAHTSWITTIVPEAPPPCSPSSRSDRATISAYKARVNSPQRPEPLTPAWARPLSPLQLWVPTSHHGHHHGAAALPDSNLGGHRRPPAAALDAPPAPQARGQQL